MYNHELTLISYKVDKDEIGNDITIPIKRKILCKVADIGQYEFYNAKVSDLKPEIKFIIHEFEYEGEKEVEFEGERYEVLRTYRKKYRIGEKKSGNILEAEEIELTCEKVIGHGS